MYFLAYRQVTHQLISESYFMDQLKWMLKHSSLELEYGLYVQAMFDPDFFKDDVFKPGKFEELDKKYSHRFKKDFSPAFESSEPPVSSPDGKEDTPPF